MPLTIIGRLKKTARPYLAPALRRFGLRQPLPLEIPRVSDDEQLRELDVPTRVSVRPDETLLVNGRPFFPIGVYYAHSEIADRSGAGLQRLREMGFNTVLFDGKLDTTEPLDRIHRAGLSVWYRPPGQLHGAFAILKETLRRIGRHPALLGWEMDDEPILNDLIFETVRSGCDLVRRIDRFHPILCNQWFPGMDRIGEVTRWATLPDVHGFGVYPVPLARWRKRQPAGNGGLPESIAVVGAQVALWRTVAAGKPVIPVLQAFAWNSLEDGDDSFPTTAESRFMAYHSVISGAKGLHHYGVPSAGSPCVPCGVPPLLHADLNRTYEEFLGAQAANERFWKHYRSVIRELADMTDVFTAPDAPWAPVSESDSSHPVIRSRVKQLEDSWVILAVNTSASATAVRFRAPELAQRTIHVWGESRSIDVDVRGNFVDRFDAFGVRVYSDRPNRLARTGEAWT